MVLKNRNIIVDILSALFGIGSWIGINSMFVQLPLLVIDAPEGWNLPSYMSIAVQIANIGPIIYAIFQLLIPNGKRDKFWILALLSLGVISALLVPFFYNYKVAINGKDTSLIFLILVFITALVGCSSSVLFYPYMRHFKEIYIISYFIGEGLSGFLPSIFALIQGVGGDPKCEEIDIGGNTTINLIYNDPRFGVDVFFFIIAVFSCISLGSFVLLISLKISKKEQVTQNTDKERIELNENSNENISVNPPSNQPSNFSLLKSISLLILMGTMCAFGNGIFPSIQSYSCLPYGNTAYHLAVSLGNMANPTACFLALFLPRTSYKSISILATICSIFVGYLLATSLLSPIPPLVDNSAGIVLVVISWIIAIGLVSYIKLCISTIFRAQGGTWMFYCGAASQFGSAIGSVVIFVLVNYADIFTPSDPCRLIS